jgi:hypothetical protein
MSNPNSSHHIEKVHFVSFSIKKKDLLDESERCVDSVGFFVDKCVDIEKEDETVSK